MELNAVSIMVPNELLSYSLLGKLGGNTHLSQHINHSNSLNAKKEHNSSALITSFEELHKIIFYCSHGKHNKRCTTLKKEDFWADNPHLKPSFLEKKRKNNPSPNLSIAQALTKIGGSSAPTHDQVVVYYGTAHHVFNSPKRFIKQLKKIDCEVAIGDSSSKLWAQGIGIVQLECKGQVLNLRNCLYLQKLKCNLISLLELFKYALSIQQIDNNFSLISSNRTLLKGEINNHLMYITYNLPASLLKMLEKNLFHC
ncbi:hypothetical protein O181_117187 [Austropuccinia psidii MF-1]|uniref:Retrovirus-related Pol polyprotein from transposon TNT 1-94-like beta-barrel domain-containing protein n=1 Tax=Austropuccinia psidii MF-1 TaxID=1389203 RepID=A0A9Q3KCV7_9BASI|nr:hypothetical protein [Austropuccinia psidii MF-1]